MENLYNKASLVLTPQMVETGKVYSMKPEDRKGDFTFSRSTYATRVGPTGLIEKETQNLLLQSNQFDTTWANASTGETGGQTDKDGGSTAWLIQKGGTGGYIYQSITSSGVKTFSVYAKAGTLNWLRISIGGGTFSSSYFDLANGVVGAVTSNIISNAIESIGGGWYRCSISVNKSISGVFIYPADGDGDVSGTSGSIYIQDAQLEQGLVARDYIETTTTAIYGGITDNVPRLDYTDSSCPALLLEPQRRNMITHSEYIDGLSVFYATTSFEDVTSPEGVNGVYEITTTTTTQNHFVSNDNIINPSTTYTISGYFKKSTKRYCWIGINHRTSIGGYIGQYQSIFDLDTGSWTNDLTEGTNPAYVNKDFKDMGNGWYRLILTCTLGSNAGILRSCYGIAKDANNTYYGGSTTDAIYLWGLQAEDDGSGNGSSYATSYIPTYGSAVTRNAETCVDAGNASIFNDSEGVLYAEIAATDDTAGRWISLSNGTSNERISVANQSGNLRIYIKNTAGVIWDVTIYSPNGYDDIFDFNKIALRYKSGDYAFYVNGTQVVTNTSTSLASNISSLQFNSGGGSSPFYGNTKQLLYFPTALTDEELAQLTAL